VKGVGRDTMEILHEDPVSLVLALQQNVTLHAAVVCHQKAMLTVCVERVTLARDVTGKCGTLIVLNEALCINQMIGSDFSLKL
jgi:hypothetical protein